MVGKKVAQRAIAAGLAGMMSFGAMAPAALAIDERPVPWWWSADVNDDDDLRYFRRISGDTRYDTMKKIVDATYRVSGDTYWHATTAVVASGDNFPDALAANGLAGALNDGDGAPVILTKKGALSSQAKTLLEKMQVQHVYIMGGTAAVSENVETAIRNMKIATTRVAGADRQATSAEAFRLIDGNWYKAHGTHSVIIATGKTYADALSIAPFAYSTGTPVILTKDDGTLTDEQVKYIKDNDEIWQVIVLGGTEAVSDSVFSALGTYNGSYRDYYNRNYISVRIAGSDRYDTSAKIADWEVNYALDTDSLAGSSAVRWADFSYNWTFVATGENFPDALAGGQLAGGKWYTTARNLTVKEAHPILLTKDGNRSADFVIAKSLAWNTDKSSVKADVYASVFDYMAELLPGGLMNYTADDLRNTILSDITDRDYGFFLYNNVSIMDQVKDVPKPPFEVGEILVNSGLRVDATNFEGIILGGRNAVSKDKAKELNDAVEDSIYKVYDDKALVDDVFKLNYYNLVRDIRNRNVLALGVTPDRGFRNTVTSDEIVNHIVQIPYTAGGNYYYRPIEVRELLNTQVMGQTVQHQYAVKFAQFEKVTNFSSLASLLDANLYNSILNNGYLYDGDVWLAISEDANGNLFGGFYSAEFANAQWGI